MEELKRINARIAMKQFGRIGFGMGSLVLGVILIGKYMYQAGITTEQRFLAETYPDVYDILTEKVLEEFNNIRKQ